MFVEEARWIYDGPEILEVRLRWISKNVDRRRVSSLDLSDIKYSSDSNEWRYTNLQLPLPLAAHWPLPSSPSSFSPSPSRPPSFPIFTPLLLPILPASFLNGPRACRHARLDCSASSAAATSAAWGASRFLSGTNGGRRLKAGSSSRILFRLTLLHLRRLTPYSGRMPSSSRPM